MVLQGLLAEFFGTEILPKQRRHAAFQARSGEAKTSKNHGKLTAFALFRWNFVLSKAFFESFLRENFCKGKPKAATIIKSFSQSRFFVGTSFCDSVLRKFLARKFLQSMGATHCFMHGAGKREQAKNHKKFLGFTPFRRNLVLSRPFFENFLRENSCKAWAPRSVSSTKRGSKNEQKSWQVSCIRALWLELRSFKGVLRKFLAGKFLQSMGATQRFKREAGKQKRAKIMASSVIRALWLEPRSFKGVLRKFLVGKFLQGIGATQRFKHEAGKQKRAKIMASSVIRGLLLELCSRKVCSGNFSARKLLQSMGATQRFKREAGEQKRAKFMGCFWICAVRGAWGAKTLSTEEKR